MNFGIMKYLTIVLLSVLFIFVPTAAMAFAEVAEVTFLDRLNNFFDSFPVWLAALTTVVTAATAITVLTPTKSDDAFVNKLLRLLNLLAGNFGLNKNKDDK